MSQEFEIDYESFVELSSELAEPISSKGLNSDTLKRLYESKLIYLERLRQKCFKEMNDKVPENSGFLRRGFSRDDYEYILHAQARNKEFLRHVVVALIKTGIHRIK